MPQSLIPSTPCPLWIVPPCKLPTWPMLRPHGTEPQWPTRLVRVVVVVVVDDDDFVPVAAASTTTTTTVRKSRETPRHRSWRCKRRRAIRVVAHECVSTIPTARPSTIVVRALRRKSPRCTDSTTDRIAWLVARSCRPSRTGFGSRPDGSCRRTERRARQWRRCSEECRFLVAPVGPRKWPPRVSVGCKRLERLVDDDPNYRPNYHYHYHYHHHHTTRPRGGIAAIGYSCRCPWHRQSP
mmetsp:Transcript_11519/g.31892  ORF Transcript_11519/g.31892 Transcript_11519/m.31892 type:complete len:239 (-) Transcript_11519:362-1078(-)